MIINTIFCMLYYNVIISWALFYFVSSFRKTLLWSKCEYWWNDDRCIASGVANQLYKINEMTYNCTEAQYRNISDYSCIPTTNQTLTYVTATEQFF